MQRVSDKLQRRRYELIYMYNVCIGIVGVTLAIVLLIVVMMLVLT